MYDHSCACNCCSLSNYTWLCAAGDVSPRARIRDVRGHAQLPSHHLRCLDHQDGKGTWRCISNTWLCIGSLACASCLCADVLAIRFASMHV